jgi:hypothetical protein
MPLVTKGDCGSSGIVFLFDRDPRLVERLLGHLAREALGPQVDEHEVRVGAARHDREARSTRASASAFAFATTCAA